MYPLDQTDARIDDVEEFVFYLCTLNSLYLRNPSEKNSFDSFMKKELNNKLLELRKELNASADSEKQDVFVDFLRDLGSNYFSKNISMCLYKDDFKVIVDDIHNEVAKKYTENKAVDLTNKNDIRAVSADYTKFVEESDKELRVVVDSYKTKIGDYNKVVENKLNPEKIEAVFVATIKNKFGENVDLNSMLGMIYKKFGANSAQELAEKRYEGSIAEITDIRMKACDMIGKYNVNLVSKIASLQVAEKKRLEGIKKASTFELSESNAEVIFN